MKSLSTSVVAAALLVAGVNAQFQINTPNPPTQCVPVQFSWTGGTAPYFLAITPGGVAGAAALQQYQGLTGNSFTWSSNITAGTSIGLTLTDSTGAVAQSAPVTIQSGPDNSCLNGAASSGSGQSTAASSGAATSGVTTPTTGAASGTTASTKAASSGSGAGSTTASSSRSTSTTSASSSSGNGALSNVVSAGVVGVIGAVAAAFLA